MAYRIVAKGVQRAAPVAGVTLERYAGAYSTKGDKEQAIMSPHDTSTQQLRSPHATKRLLRAYLS